MPPHSGKVKKGSSLGGIVACQITKIRHMPKLFLVGSAMPKEEISGCLTALHPLAKISPAERQIVGTPLCLLQASLALPRTIQSL